MEETKSVDGTTICFDRIGGDGPPLALAHATGFCASVWDPMLPVFKKHFNCFALDFRAHGRSGVPSDGQYQWSHVSEDLLAMIDASGLADETWVGVGHSMGGAALLISELARPGLFRSAWMFEPIVMPPQVRDMSLTVENPLVASARRRRLSFDSYQAAFDNYQSKPPMSSFTVDALHGYLRHGLVELADGSVELSCKPENEAEFYLMGSEHRTFDRLGEITSKVVVARGENTSFSPAAFASDVVAGLQNGSLAEYGSLSHFGPMEDPITLANDIVVALTEGSR